MKESPKGTHRASRTKSDMESCTQILKQTNDDIGYHSIRDCIQLGKYKSSSTRPRPILVKLTRVLDANTVLYNRSKAPDNITIKLDMSLEEKLRESILLSERWNLICSGIDKKDIKIYSLKLYLKGTLFGEVSNSVFLCSQPSNVSNNLTMNTEAPATTCPDSEASTAESHSDTDTGTTNK